MNNSKVKSGLGWLCLILATLTFCITLTINFRPLYLFDIDYLHILTYTSLDKQTLIKNFDQLMGYLNNPFLGKLVMADFPVSESGALHFYEVKRLFMLNYGVLLVTIVPAVLFIRKLIKERQLWKLIQPTRNSMLILLFLPLLMLMGFDRFFVQFHSLFFNNDAWLFNPATDPIINVLPETFFMHCFILFFISIEVVLFIGYFTGKRSLKKVPNE